MLKVFWDFLISNKVLGVVCVTVENPAFSLALYLTGIHFRGELQHVGHVSVQKIKCWPIVLFIWFILIRRMFTVRITLNFRSLLKYKYWFMSLNFYIAW